jgi:hypothetical protein
MQWNSKGKRVRYLVKNLQIMDAYEVEMKYCNSCQI